MRVELVVIILALATWRMASMFASGKEEGPWHIFSRLRAKVGIERELDLSTGLEKENVPPKFFAELLSCVWCASVWCAFFWTVLYLAFPAVTPWLGLTFALSALAILIDRIA